MSIDLTLAIIGRPQVGRGAPSGPGAACRSGEGRNTDAIRPQAVRIAVQRRGAVMLAPHEARTGWADTAPAGGSAARNSSSTAAELGVHAKPTAAAAACARYSSSVAVLASARHEREWLLTCSAKSGGAVSVLLACAAAHSAPEPLSTIIFLWFRPAAAGALFPFAAGRAVLRDAIPADIVAKRRRPAPRIGSFIAVAVAGAARGTGCAACPIHVVHGGCLAHCSARVLAAAAAAVAAAHENAATARRTVPVMAVVAIGIPSPLVTSVQGALG
jgi:hypothetical protein